MTSGDILKLLQAKHSEDVFIPECKDGPTQSVSRYLKLDAWAMKRSWSNPVTYGYEIKVSRGDFIRDTKWRGYLPLCSSFYFACPMGLIAPEELPPEVGLLWVSANGGRLFTKRVAPFRDVTIPEKLYRYILMCRVAITTEDRAMDRRAMWERWLQEKAEDRKLGHMVRGGIGKTVDAVRRENEKLREENGTLAEVKAVLKELKLDHNYDPASALRWQHKRLMDALPQGMEQNLKHLGQQIDNMLATFRESKKQAGALETEPESVRP